MDTFHNQKGGPVVLAAMVTAIRDNKDYLGEVDGLIGDGDHGANMNKGFASFAARYGGEALSFTEGLDALGLVLMNEIGGSMGPIYGTVFTGMAEAGQGMERLGTAELAAMLEAGLAALADLVDARTGDKTLVDTLAPATAAMRRAADEGMPLPKALAGMKTAAERGRDATKDLVARYGRSARLGARSRGVPDAGAVSCCLLLCAMADGMARVMEQEG